MATGFFWDEACFWHGGGHYAFTHPVGGWVQPLVAGGLPEAPETKRRLKNLIDRSGLSKELRMSGADPVTWSDMRQVHPEHFLQEFKRLSDSGGGEIGDQAPFGPGGFEICTQSAGLVKGALFSVLTGQTANAYALSRPPGHHALPDHPNGFCILANVAIAAECAMAEGLAGRVAIIDWDVHHGNGTEAIFYDRPDVLTISLHQDRNYPEDTGAYTDRGAGPGEGFNINIPLPPGTGHHGYLYAFEQIVRPALDDFRPDVIIVACGFDAAIVDPLSRMMCTAETYRQMTRSLMEAAEEHCEGRLVMAHEGGYSEFYVPFCGHAVLEEMSGSTITVPDPLGETYDARQPGPRHDAMVEAEINDIAAHVLPQG